MTLDLVLGIITKELDIVLILLSSLTDQQKRDLWARHEIRQARWDRIVDKLTPDHPPEPMKAG